MTDQQQFLDCLDRDEAERRFRAALQLAPLGEETVALAAALGRVLARDVASPVDVPSFDRSNFDGFAVQAADTYGAQEERPAGLTLVDAPATMGCAPAAVVVAGSAAPIATGGMLPRGADAVVMIEYTDVAADRLLVRRSVAPGAGVTFAGTDVAAGELALRRGETLTSRETGVLAAIGVDRVVVRKRPRVAILSTGDELIAPGDAMRAGLVYDSNARILADAVRELGGVPLELGIIRDEFPALQRGLADALATADVVLLSGGTSKGAGDLSYRAVAELANPGVVVHGVALKPGKPICLAASDGKPVVVLPGFPTSAIFTFHEFVAPVIAALAGRTLDRRQTALARLAVKVNSEVGRTEYLLVGLVDAGDALAAYPMGKGSGSVTTFSRADGFVTIDRHIEIVDAGANVQVHLLARDLRLPDLVVIGSHCLGLDWLLGELQDRGLHTKFLAVGSMAGLAAAQRGECDVASVHLLDPATGEYNRPFVTDALALIRGYGRIQGFVFRADDARFARLSAAAAGIGRAAADPECVMVNRNQGSGTRILIDRALDGSQPRGYAVQAKNHSAVAAAVAQGRADWGVAIAAAAAHHGLGFLPLADEQFDFVTPRARSDRRAVQEFCKLLNEPRTQARLAELGLRRGS